MYALLLCDPKLVESVSKTLDWHCQPVYSYFSLASTANNVVSKHRMALVVHGWIEANHDLPRGNYSLLKDAALAVSVDDTGVRLLKSDRSAASVNQARQLVDMAFIAVPQPESEAEKMFRAGFGLGYSAGSSNDERLRTNADIEWRSMRTDMVLKRTT